MTLYIAALNSGSNGNCYYVGNGTDAVLVDVGITCRETEKRMERLGLPIETVRAIFVSHEHSDHITGIPALAKKYMLPVFITPATYRASGVPILPDLIQTFSPHVPVQIGALSITAFPKFHDADDPHSFIVSNGNATIGIFTDIGHSCKEVIKYFKLCHAVFLESNYCVDMLRNGRYPAFLKHRISSDRGHLSNDQALDLFIKYRSAQLSHLILSHLSKNNNAADVVAAKFNAHAGNTAIMIASRYAETPVYAISPAVTRQKKMQRQSAQLQLSLF